MAKIELEIGANVQDLLAGFEQMKKQMSEFDAKMKGTFEKMSKEGEDAAQSLSKAMTESMTKSATSIDKTNNAIEEQNNLLIEEQRHLELFRAARDKATSVQTWELYNKQVKKSEQVISNLSRQLKQFKDITNMSLGEMRKYMRELRNISLVGMSPKQIAEVNGKIAELTDAMGDYRAMLGATGDKTEMVIESFQGLVGIAQGVTGTLALFGVENKKLEKSMMALINLSMAMQTFHQMNEKGILKAYIATVKDIAAKYMSITATKAQMITQKAATASTMAGATAFKIMGLAMKAVPIVALIAGLTAIGVGIYTMVENMRSANEESRLMGKLSKSLIADFSKESAHLETMGKAIRDAKVGTTERRDAINALNKEYKEYLPYLLTEKSSNEAVANALAIVNAQLMQNLITKIKVQTLEDLYTKKIEAELKIIEKQVKQQEELKKAEEERAKGNTTSAKQHELNAGVFTDGINVQKDAIVKLDNEIAKMDAAFLKLATQYGTSLTATQKALIIVSNGATSAGQKATNTTHDNTKAVKENVATYEKSAKVLSQEAIAINALKNAWEELDPTTRNVMSQFAEIRDDGLLRAVLADDADALYKYYEDSKITWEKYMELLDIVQSHRKAMAEGEVDWMSLLTNVGKKAAKELYDTYKQSLDNQISATEDYIGRRTQMIGELESLLAAEVQLNEQGYASNIQIYQQRIQKEQQLRDEAMAQKEKYEKRKQAIETVSQAIDMSSAIAAMLKDAGVKFGVLAPIIGGAMIAALLMLFKKSKTQAAQTARFAKGGKGILQGASHSAGGVNLGEIGEGEGGEAYYILNKKATAKNRSLMDAVFDAVNGNRINLPLDAIASGGGTMTVELKEQAEIKEILKHMKSQKATVYGNGFRDETFGNVRRRIWTN